MKHVVKEADASVDCNLLRLAVLRGVLTPLEKAGVSVGREVPAVEVESELDLGLVGVASQSGPSGREL